MSDGLTQYQLQLKLQARISEAWLAVKAWETAANGLGMISAILAPTPTAIKWTVDASNKLLAFAEQRLAAAGTEYDWSRAPAVVDAVLAGVYDIIGQQQPRPLDVVLATAKDAKDLALRAAGAVESAAKGVGIGAGAVLALVVVLYVLGKVRR